MAITCSLLIQIEAPCITIGSSLLAEVLDYGAVVRELEVCDEADSCGEAVGASVKRNDKDGLQNCGIVPPRFAETVNVWLLDVRRVSRELIGTLNDLHALYCPKRAAVLGASTLGLMSSLVLRLRGLEVTSFGNTMPPFLNSRLLEELGVLYVSTKETSLTDASTKYGPFDLILEGTGYSPLVFEAMNILAKNGVLAVVSVTGGSRQLEVPADKINLGFVLGNKVAFGSVNANREYFEAGVKDLSTAELQYPGWLKRLLTHPVKGLENYEEIIRLLAESKGSIKVYCEVAAFEGAQTAAAAT